MSPESEDEISALRDLFSLRGRRIWLWGVGGTLGSAIAKNFCRLGAGVAGISRSEQEIAEIHSAVAGTCGTFLGGMCCDITQEDGVKQALGFARDVFSGAPIDICIIVAGGVGYVIGPHDKFHEGDFDRWRDTVELNYLAPVHAVMKTIPMMIKSESPLIGAICSMSYTGNMSRTGAYRNAKSALHDFVLWLTAEVSKLGSHWRVLGWQPGFVLSAQNTPMLQKDPARMSAIVNKMPRREWQDADAVARGIVGSCTRAFSEAHGAIIPLAAGFPCAGLGMDVL